MPDHLKNAFMAVEDHRFKDHFGIDIRRLGGAVLANFRNGFGAEGASTITQQLAKNLFLSNEKALSRKIQEAYLAIQLERRYSKDEILEMYLNQINLGPTAGYGVQLASETYFDKEDLSELTIADAAVLAAIPQRPSHFDRTQTLKTMNSVAILSLIGWNGKDLLRQRKQRKLVIQILMTKLTIIRQKTTVVGSRIMMKYYDEVLSELESMTDLSSNDIYNSGLKVYTTLDTDAQELVDDVLKSGEYSNLPFPDNEDFRAGVTLIDNNSGAIRAMGNGTEQNDARVSNYATIRNNQGSTMKPLLGYGPVIENEQWPTAEIIVDEPYYYEAQSDREVRNFDRSHSGPMTMREALSRSRNVTAVKAINEVGVENAYEFLDQMFVVDDGRVESGILGPALASTKEMAGAYAAFANNGEYTEHIRSVKLFFQMVGN